MKFNTNVVLCLFSAGVYSAAVNVRDLPSIEDAFAKIQNGVDTLTKAAQSFQGGSNIQPVVDAAKNLIGTINAGSDTAKASAPLSVGDSMKLLGPLGELKKHTQDLDSVFKQRVPDIQQGKACDIARTVVDQIENSAGGFTKNLVDKVPAALQGVANQEGKGFTDQLEDAKKSLDACKNA